MTNIYISYRTGQEQKLANHIYHFFVSKFGDDSVFFDPVVNTLEAFPSERSNAIRDADVILVLIDKSWNLKALDNADDWIRIELQQALLLGKLTIPVLLGNLRLLQADDLPLNLQSLLDEEQHYIADEGQLNHLLEQLTDRFQVDTRKKKVATASRSNQVIIAIMGMLLLFLILFVGFLAFISDSEVVATNTPTQTMTDTSVPTGTAIPAQAITITPEPSETPIPTRAPTETKVPTATIMPTNTPFITREMPENGTQLLITRGSEFEGTYLYLHDLSTGEERQLSDITGGAGEWSPDGTQILFASSGPDTNDTKIYIMNADGTNLREFIQNPEWDSYPAWSPDGSQIAFSTDRDGNSEIYVMNADGTNLRNITQHEAEDYDASWSADGTQLVFTSTRLERVEIFIINVDGTNLRNLSQTADADEMSPAWSPDGTHILYETSISGWSDIILSDVNGDEVINLTNTANSSDGFPSWSPDGTQILFHSDRASEQPGFDSGAFELYVMNRDGSDVRRLTNNDEDDWEADWQPAP